MYMYNLAEKNTAANTAQTRARHGHGKEERQHVAALDKGRTAWRSGDLAGQSRDSLATGKEVEARRQGAADVPGAGSEKALGSS